MRRSILTFSALCALLLPGRAAAAAAAPAAFDPTKQRVLVPGDRITITVTGQVDLNRSLALGPSGTVSLIYIDNPVKISGMTVAQAQDRIEKTYIDERILKKPQVLITVEQTSAQYVYVTGETTKKEPILYPTDSGRNMTLLDVVQKAGFTQEARLSQIWINRPQSDGTIKRMGPYNMDDFMRGRTKNLEVNPDVLPGDTVDVPIRIL